MTPADLDELEKLCDAATPPDVEWHHSESVLWACVTSKPDGAGFVVCEANGNAEQAKARARFIAAANPQTVKALIAEVRSLRRHNEVISRIHFGICEGGFQKEIDKLRAENEALKKERDEAKRGEDFHCRREAEWAKAHSKNVDTILALEAERDALRAQVTKLEAEIATERVMREKWAEACAREGAKADRLEAANAGLQTKYDASQAALTEVMAEHVKLRDENTEWRTAHALQHEQLEALAAQVTSLKAEMARLVLGTEAKS
jgi:chromosome segregation ATPase